MIAELVVITAVIVRKLVGFGALCRALVIFNHGTGAMLDETRVALNVIIIGLDKTIEVSVLDGLLKIE